MMISKDGLRRRLENLEKIIRPKNSFAYKVFHLSPMHREIYDKWRDRMNQWVAQRPGEKAYIDLLAVVSGDQNIEAPPELPRGIYKILYPSSPEFSENDTPCETRRKYTDFLESLK